MLIVVGSKNPAKVTATEEFFSMLANSAFSLQSVATPSTVSNQPSTLEETILGACNRSRGAFNSVDEATLGIGIEGGITPVPFTHTGYMNICAASIFDGLNTYIGLSSGFEHPAKAIELVTREGLEIQDAYVSAGFENTEDFSTQGGAIGFMTNQRLSRTEYCQQALCTAYAAYEKKEFLVNLA